ncbi:hypothetical protein ACIP4W_36600 [Streptomyces sp. NPDC088846]|uniref:hypothetical protein n=1 Tax=Streptomyces sp. NPDC088846 TaxID=3365908 RepID=UPI00380D5040
MAAPSRAELVTACFRRCGHDTGPLHPGDHHKAVAEFTAMLAARQRPARWTGHGDVAVRIGERGPECGRPLPEQPPDADPVALVLIHPDTGLALCQVPRGGERLQEDVPDGGGGRGLFSREQPALPADIDLRCETTTAQARAIPPL